MNWYTDVDYQAGYRQAMNKIQSDFSSFVETDSLNLERLILPISTGKITNEVSNKIEEALNNLVAGDVVVYQHPTYQGSEYEQCLLNKLKEHQALVVIVAHDVLSIRDEQVVRFNSEIKLFNLANIIIVHTVAMKLRLKQYGVKVPMMTRELPSYQTTLNDTTVRSHDFNQVIYAGNIAKAQWLLQYDQDTPISLFGHWSWQDGPEILFSSVNYHGSVDEAQLPLQSFNGFGLVWDGWQIPDFETIGRYTKYNWPMKASMYLASGLPIITWKGSPLAELTDKYNIGFSLDDLGNLTDEMSRINVEQFKIMKQAAIIYGENIRNGFNTKSVIFDAIQIITALR
ncbi:hypothetical protein [Leuconostoc citreum]|uniref:hypothetical protein n=1 Tax=Leuconostoc citreum TaxID=33964 RepID=UPI00211B2B6A|nr:hypothetical protein [Leuconostoc citreum]MCQ6659189.1 hypothetical protein [Leuconostoc citreum]